MKPDVQGNWRLEDLMRVWEGEARRGAPHIQGDFSDVIRSHNQKAPLVWQELFILANQALQGES